MDAWFHSIKSANSVRRWVLITHCWSRNSHGRSQHGRRQIHSILHREAWPTQFYFIPSVREAAVQHFPINTSICLSGPGAWCYKRQAIGSPWCHSSQDPVTTICLSYRHRHPAKSHRNFSSLSASLTLLHWSKQAHKNSTCLTQCHDWPHLQAALTVSLTQGWSLPPSLSGAFACSATASGGAWAATEVVHVPRRSFKTKRSYLPHLRPSGWNLTSPDMSRTTAALVSGRRTPPVATKRVCARKMHRLSS
jgi:hypothetical protein